MTEETVHWPIESACPYCQSVMDRATMVARSSDVPEDEPPHEGDFTVCVDCVEYGVYYFDGQQLKIRKVTMEDLVDFPEGGLVSMIFMQAAIRESKTRAGISAEELDPPEFVNMAIHIIEERHK